MDWKLLVSTFVAIFTAELGDKTQLAALSLSAGASSRWSVFLGSSLALIATSAIAVLAGDVVARWISPVWLKRIAAVTFLVLGALFLWQSFSGGGEA
jgi:putative Ca2+/H+ antiporter (TMEM165/GDT1 family)